MMSEALEIRLVIVDSELESKVLRELDGSVIAIHGRYLQIDDIAREVQPSTILITTTGILIRYDLATLRRSFRKIVAIGPSLHPEVISIAEHELSLIPRIISDIVAHSVDSSQSTDAGMGYLIEATAPRSGVTMVTNALEENFSEELFVWRSQRAPTSQTIRLLLSEIDDYSLHSLFTVISAERGEINKRAIVGVLLNKVSQTRAAKQRVKAIERELSAIGYPLLTTIHFDAEIQVTGQPGAETHHAIRPLFDWITKPNYS